MRNVILKFLGVGYNDYYQADVIVYNKFGNSVFNGQTYNGEINILLNTNQLYLLKATFLNYCICKCFIVKDKCKYVFCFNNILPNTTTFLLTDYYYYNLPIETGELRLWQK